MTHFVASRKGLYAVNAARWELLAEGRYFGLTLRENTLYAFQASSWPRDRGQDGRIMAFELDGAAIVAATCVAEGLDDGCHQIDFIGDQLHVVDTYRQQIIVYSACFQQRAVCHPIAPGAYMAWDQGYVHCNSLLGFGELTLILLHNGGAHTGRPSRLLVCDRALQPLRQLLLPGKGCHNMVVLEDGSLLACDSLSGALINHAQRLVKLDDMMTRGLSVDSEQIAVGSSPHAARLNRADTPGRVHFLTRQLRPITTLEMPAAPTEIRRIDGKDLSLTNHARTVITATPSSSFLARPAC
ncbi:MAG: hypothetical protein V4484_08225 [Pseudomonadota bacterium]